MLKPIVSMNQMAMNESIATTCCYVWNGTSLLGSASLPHGGQLKADTKTDSFVQIGMTSYPLNNTWWGYTKGHVMNGDLAKCVVTTDKDGNTGVHNHTDGNNFVPMTAFADADVKKVGYCDHKNPDTCPYFKVTSFAKSFTHTGATSAHYSYTDGNSWLADHPAVQFSS